jgi:hypothetical protein
MAFSVERYRLSCDDYRRNWSFVDRTLYDLCAEYPGHDQPDVVLAKLMIIGRSYATGVERAVNLRGALPRLAKHLHQHAEEMDEIIDSLSELGEPVSGEALVFIVHAHAALVNLIHRLHPAGKSARSFASKYLHFHRPVVPIYDSVSDRVLTRLYRKLPHQLPIETTAALDPLYVSSLRRWRQAYIDATTILRPPEVTVKLMDHYLMFEGGAVGGE